MKVLKIFYTDFWKGFAQQSDFITPILKKHFNIILDHRNPDIVFCSTLHRMSQTVKYNQPKILYTGENHRPDGRGAEYTISFDKHSETNYYLPLWQVSCMLEPRYKEALLNRVRYDMKDSRFCSFFYSNGNVPVRNEIFHKLSEYKFVASYGELFNNDDSIKGSKSHYDKEKVLKSYGHKFGITYENSSYPGYCTEKIIHTFLVGSIPVYWGSNTIIDHFNPAAFINANDMNVEDVIKNIVYLDGNKEAFDKMYNEPVMLPGQVTDFLYNISNFETWLADKVNKIMKWN